MQRWPRFADLQSQVRSAGGEACVARFNEQDWRDLQLLSQLAWMDEEYIAKDPVVNALAAKGTGFTERDKTLLREKQLELLGAVLPAYRIAAERGQIEISTTPYYHPHSAAAVRHGYCEGFQSAHAASSPAIPLSGGRARTVAARLEVSRAGLRQAAGRVVAVRGIGV